MSEPLASPTAAPTAAPAAPAVEVRGVDKVFETRTEELREEHAFFDMVTAVREALHGGTPVGTGPRGVETR